MQVTGGYFADPGVKDVPRLAYCGYPLAEVAADGSAVITKLETAGGCVTPATVKEQLLYEVHDPQRYLTPDVTADFSEVRIEERGADRVAVSGARGSVRPEKLKVTVGLRRRLPRRSRASAMPGRTRKAAAGLPQRSSPSACARVHGWSRRLARRPHWHERAVRHGRHAADRHPGRAPAGGAPFAKPRRWPSCCCGRWSRCSAAGRRAAAAFAAASRRAS